MNASEHGWVRRVCRRHLEAAYGDRYHPDALEELEALALERCDPDASREEAEEAVYLAVLNWLD